MVCRRSVVRVGVLVAAVVSNVVVSSSPSGAGTSTPVVASHDVFTVLDEWQVEVSFTQDLEELRANEDYWIDRYSTRFSKSQGTDETSWSITRDFSLRSTCEGTPEPYYTETGSGGGRGSSLLADEAELPSGHHELVTWGAAGDHIAASVGYPTPQILSTTSTHDCYGDGSLLEPVPENPLQARVLIPGTVDTLIAAPIGTRIANYYGRTDQNGYVWKVHLVAVKGGDRDGDGVSDAEDNCYLPNADQLDALGDGTGDACEDPWLIALGDSFQSGEGAYDYHPETDTEGNICHRSSLSYPFLAVAQMPDLPTGAGQWRAKSVACSGAISDNLTSIDFNGEPPQIEQLADAIALLNVRAVTVGIGGNDAKFSTILTKCLAGGSCIDIFEGADASPSIDTLLADAVSEAAQSYQAIAFETAKAGHEITVTVVGYPVFMGIPKNLDDDCENGFGASEVLWMRSRILEFNRLLAAKAAEYGFRFVALDAAYDGNVLCEGSDDQWINDIEYTHPSAPCINKLILNDLAIACESFHPKAAGHAATAPYVRDCILDAFTCPSPSAELPSEGIEYVDSGVGSRQGAGQIILDIATLVGRGPITATLFSEPVHLGTAQPEADGSALLDLAIPPSVLPGEHTVQVCRDGPIGGALRVCDAKPITISGVPPAPPPAIVSLQPARLLETRVGSSLQTVDGISEGIGRVAAKSVTQLGVTGRGGVAPDAEAVVLNVSAVTPSGAGYVTVFPCGTTPPLAANLTYAKGDVVANAVLSQVGVNGKVCLYSEAATDLVVDATGYVPVDGSPGATVPARLLETRSGPGLATADGQSQGEGRRLAKSTYELSVLGRGSVPLDAKAVWLNVTAVSPSGSGYLTVFPCGEPRPLAANLTYAKGDIVANAILAALGHDGKVCVYTEASTHLVVDVAGSVPSNGSPSSIDAARLLETRSGPGLTTIDGDDQGTGRMLGKTVYELDVTYRPDVPNNATAAMLNVTAVSPSGPGFLTVYPCGSPRPLASSLNYAKGDVRANAVLAQIGTDGKVCVYTERSTHVVIDVNGYVR